MIISKPIENNVVNKALDNLYIDINMKSVITLILAYDRVLIFAFMDFIILYNENLIKEVDLIVLEKLENCFTIDQFF